MHESRTGTFEALGIGKLVSVGGVQVGDEDRRSCEREELADGGCSRTADDQRRTAHALRHVIEETRQLHLERRAGIGVTDTLEILAAALLDDAQPALDVLRQGQHRRGHDIGENAGALAAADDEQFEPSVGPLADRSGKARTYRIAGDDPAGRTGGKAVGILEAQRDDLREPSDMAIGATEDGVLLMHHHRHRTQARRECRRNGGVAAEAGDRARTKVTHRGKAFEQPLCQREERAGAPHPATARAGGVDLETGHVRGKVAHPAPVGEEGDAVAPAGQLAREGKGRKDMATGAARGDDIHAAHAPPPRRTPRRVRARSMPRPTPSASIDEPP